MGFIENMVFIEPTHLKGLHVWNIIDLLWPSDTIWRNLYGSLLAQVMACCLTVTIT